MKFSPPRSVFFTKVSVLDPEGRLLKTAASPALESREDAAKWIASLLGDVPVKGIDDVTILEKFVWNCATLEIPAMNLYQEHAAAEENQ